MALFNREKNVDFNMSVLCPSLNMSLSLTFASSVLEMQIYSEFFKIPRVVWCAGISWQRVAQ
jgi:hypothetical protein